MKPTISLRYLGLLALTVILIISGVSTAQDTVWVWYGDVDDSPIYADIGDTLEIYAYIQTSDNVYGGTVLFNLAGNNTYFDSLISTESGEIYEPFSEWDVPYFNDPTWGSPLPQGWKNQAFVGIREVTLPYNSPILHSLVPIQALKYVFLTADDDNNIGNLVEAIAPGYDLYQGYSNCTDTSGLISYTVEESASLVQFSGGGWVNGIITDTVGNPISAVTVTCSQTDRSVLSDSDGEYTIGLAPGEYDLRFTAEGYRELDVSNVIVTLNQTTDLNVTMDVDVGIDETYLDLLPDNFELKQNYPNPFNATTSIRYNLTEPTHVLLTVYDIQGRLVEKLVDSKQEAGIHTISWNAENLSSGLYLYKIQTERHSKTNKMILLK